MATEDIFTLGLDDWMRLGGEELGVPDSSPSGSGTATGNVAGSASTGTVNDTPFPESASMSNPMTGSGNPANFTSGSELGAILAFGKKSFTDTAAGWIQGMDSDGFYKWLIGNDTYSIDWSVTTSGVLTLVGAITATSGTIGGFSIGSTTISATNLALTSGSSNAANITVGTGATAGGLNSASVGGDIVFWAGSTFANRATAPFRVTAAGALTATSVTIPAGAAGVTSVWIPPSEIVSSAGGTLSTAVAAGNFARVYFSITNGATNGGVFSFRLPSGFTAISAVILYYNQEASAPTFDAYVCNSADGEDVHTADQDSASGFTCASGTSNIVKTIDLVTAFDGNTYTAGDLVSCHIYNVGVAALPILGIRIDLT